MPFDPITWALGFGATQSTRRLLGHLFNKDVRDALSKVANKWSASLPDEITTSPDVVLNAEGSGPARERLQLRLFLHNRVPDEDLWFEALLEAWRSRKAALGETGNGFLLQTTEAASPHLRALAASLSLECRKQSDLFQVSALHHLEEIASQTETIKRDVGITMSAVLNHLDNIAFRPQLINQRAISQLLENPHHCHGQGLMELNSLLLIDASSSVISGRIRVGESWVGAPGTPIEEAWYLPPGPTSLRKLVAEFVGKWASTSTPFHSKDTNEVYRAIASFHHELVSLHPFEDANGRVARVLTDYQARHLLYCQKPLRLRSDDAYYPALRKADDGDIEEFTSLLRVKIEASTA